MNGDAFSDLVLAVACAFAARRAGRGRPAFVLAAAVLAVAACLGVARFGGAPWALAPHRFASRLGACVSFPMLAVDALARARAVGRAWRPAAGVAALLTAVGTIAHTRELPALRSGLAAASLMALAYAAFRMPSHTRTLGAAAMVGAAVVAAAVPPQAAVLGVLDGVQTLHALLALAVTVLARA